MSTEEVSKARLIKYMGSADVRIINKGDDFGGELVPGAPRDFVWNWGNRHILDLSDVDAEFVSRLLESPDFRDVTDRKRVPVNQAQVLWRGAAPNQHLLLEQEVELPTQDLAQPDDEDKPSGGSVSAASSVSDPATST